MSEELENKQAEKPQQSNNPNRFVCNGITVNVSFTEGGKSLSELLTAYFISRKAG